MATSVRIPAQRGFNLLELAIVLVVIGLVCGGIVVGRSLIRGAEVRSVLTDFDRVKTSANAFNIKYHALPGDFDKATSFWGSAGGDGSSADPACYTVDTTTSKLTCNGDKDGKVGITDNTGGVISAIEWFLFWKHLSNAGLVSGTYSDTTNAATPQFALPGVNVMTSRISGAGYTFYYWGNPTVSTWYPGSLGHVLSFGLKDTVWNNETLAPVLSGNEALALDVKGDDGLPGKGNVRSYNTQVNNCATSDDPSLAVYSKTDSVVCSLIFVTGF